MGNQVQLHITPINDGDFKFHVKMYWNIMRRITEFNIKAVSELVLNKCVLYTAEKLGIIELKNDKFMRHRVRRT